MHWLLAVDCQRERMEPLAVWSDRQDVVGDFFDKGPVIIENHRGTECGMALRTQCQIQIRKMLQIVVLIFLLGGRLDRRIWYVVDEEQGLCGSVHETSRIILGHNEIFVYVVLVHDLPSDDVIFVVVVGESVRYGK